MPACDARPVSDMLAHNATLPLTLRSRSLSRCPRPPSLSPHPRPRCRCRSPYYLARARDNAAYWKRLRQPSRWLGGVDGTGVDFMQCAAEDIPQPDASFDIVSGATYDRCRYLPC